MRIVLEAGVLTVTGLRELSADNADLVRREIISALTTEVQTLDMDLSDATFVDSYGLGVLLAIQKAASKRNGTINLRLVNPTPPVQQMLELTRLHRVFEVVVREGELQTS